MFFPEFSQSTKHKEYMINMKRRALLIQEAIINFDLDGKNTEKIAELDDFIFEAYDPKVFSGKKSVELTLLKDHANTATIIQESLNANPKEMTTFEYYQKLSYLQDKAKQQKKNAKKTK